MSLLRDLSFVLLFFGQLSVACYIIWLIAATLATKPERCVDEPGRFLEYQRSRSLQASASSLLTTLDTEVIKVLYADPGGGSHYAAIERLTKTAFRTIATLDRIQHQLHPICRNEIDPSAHVFSLYWSERVTLHQINFQLFYLKEHSEICITEEEENGDGVPLTHVDNPFKLQLTLTELQHEQLMYEVPRLQASLQKFVEETNRRSAEWEEYAREYTPPPLLNTSYTLMRII